MTDRRAEHLLSVLKVSLGSEVQVGVLFGQRYAASVLEIDREKVLLELKDEFPSLKHASIDLVLALPRPQTLKKVLQTAATMGVRRLVLTRAARVEKSYFQSHLLSSENLEREMLLGLEQSTSTHLPEVIIYPKFRACIEEEFEKAKLSKENLLIAHPGSKNNLLSLDSVRKLSQDAFLTLAIGPEGGWLDYEVEQFEKNGFTAFSIGERILRVETAVCALLAQIELLRQL